MKSIYFVDDDVFFNNKISNFLKTNGYFVKSFTRAEDSLESLDQYIPDLIITDLRLPGMDGLELLKKIKLNYNRLPVILITNYSDVKTAVKSIKIGAYEFISKPINPQELLKITEKAIETSQKTLKDEKSTFNLSLTNVIKSKNEKMSATWSLIDKVAPTDLSVFIEGESGTGKEYVARYIHAKSKRYNQPFVIVDCGIINEHNIDKKLFGAHDSNKVRLSNQLGFFEIANGGTIFFDEITNLSPLNQIKILRVIQERTIEINQVQVNLDIRFISSSNINLEEAVQKDILRNDLYFRLNEFPVKLTPLRDRTEDVVDFITHFVNEAQEELGKKNVRLKIDLINEFKKYTWPGNLRELRNFIKRGVLLTDNGIIEKEHLPDFKMNVISKNQHLNENLKTKSEALEIEMIKTHLVNNKYNISKTAKSLNITRTTLYKKMKYYDLK